MERNFLVRTMKREEVDIAADWAEREGWNPGLYDADSFYATDPQGFLIGLLDGEPVATISAVKYGDTFGFIGFYIVKHELRQLGFGHGIWKGAMKRLEGRNIALDTVLAQQWIYEKSGFWRAYGSIRFEGAGTGEKRSDPRIVSLSSVPFEAVETYDRLMFPEARSTFLKHWFNQPESVSLGFLKDGRLAGCGMIRVCRKGRKIGPLYADDAGIADALFDALRAEVSLDEPVYLDVPEVNGQGIVLARSHKMTPVFATARMYLKANPPVPMGRLFGVTSFELG
jgi:hypothetical protein